jgi:hypothetical protein
VCTTRAREAWITASLDQPRTTHRLIQKHWLIIIVPGILTAYKKEPPPVSGEASGGSVYTIRCYCWSRGKSGRAVCFAIYPDTYAITPGSSGIAKVSIASGSQEMR